MLIKRKILKQASSVFFFDVYGFKIKLESFLFNNKDLKITEDYAFFASREITNVDLNIEIFPFEQKVKSGFYLGKTSMCEMYQISYNLRYLYFKNNIGFVSDFSKSKQTRHICIYTSDLQACNDIIYFCVQSCLGEHLDFNQKMRIHGFSFSKNEKSVVVHGASGVGKSSLAKLCLGDENINIFSDETSLLDLQTLSILPFPLRISEVLDIESIDPKNLKFNYFFSGKGMISIPNNKISKPKRFYYFISLEKHSRSNFAILFYQVVFGIGLMQMREYMLRPNNILKLLMIFLYRIRLFLIIFKLRPLYLVREENPLKTKDLVLNTCGLQD